MKGIFFDVDGVLVDSLWPHIEFCRAMERQYKRHGPPLPADRHDLEECRRVAGNPMDRFLLNAGFFPDDIDELIATYRREFRRKYEVRPFPGVPEMLEKLKEAEYLLGIASSNHESNIKTALGENAYLFDFVATKDNSKNKGEGLKQGIKQLGLHPLDTLFVGDTMSDYRAAKKAGIVFIGAGYGWELTETTPYYMVMRNVETLERVLLSIRSMNMER